jgi:hypothetical protein
VERRIWLGRISARYVWNEEHVGKSMGCKSPPNQRIQSAMSYDTVPGAAAFIWQRAGELKAPGYKRVIIAGQSWGSWVAMVADQEKDFAAEALWLIVPTSGPRRGANGSPKLVRRSTGHR